MATSPDFVRFKSSSARAIAESVLDAVLEATLVIDARQRHLPIVHANAAARRALIPALDPGSLLETSVLRLIAPASLNELEERFKAVADDAGGPIVWRLVSGDRALSTRLQRLDTGSNVSLYALIFSEALPHPDLGSALEQMPMEVVIADGTFNVVYANARARRTLESSGNIIGAPILNFSPVSSMSLETLRQALGGHPFHDDALQIKQPDGAIRWFDLAVRPLTTAKGAPGLIVMYCEVTEQRLRQRAQSSSERRLLALTAHARDIISIADTDGRVQYVSGGIFNSLGYSQEERRSNFIFEHMHPDDYPEARAKFQQLIAGEIRNFNKEIRLRHKDGTYRWLECCYVGALDNPLIGGVVINSRDVTERKEAEFRLAQREEVFRLAADAVDGVIFEWDIARGVVQRSRGVQKVLGMQPEDLEASVDIWQERIHPRDFEASRRAMSLALLNGKGWATTYRIRDAAGRYKSILERGLIQRGPYGDPARAIGCAVDVSEIKRLTDLLADTQRAANIGGWEFSFATRELAWTEEMFRIYETTAPQFTPTWESMLAQFVPGGAERFRETLAHAEQGSGGFDLEVEIRTLKRQRLWVKLIGHLEMLDGRPFRAYGSLQNIQAQKLSQIALENTSGWLRLSMNMAHLHAWRWDRTQDAFDFTTLQGHPVSLPGIYAGMEAFLVKVHPSEQTPVRQAIDRAFAQRREVREEFRLQRNDGRYYSYATTARPLFDEAGVPQGLVGVIQDVTGLRESERRLRESEELLRTTTANTADTLYLLDASLRVQFINRPVNGLSIESIIGRDVEVLLPVEERARVLERLRHLLQTGETAVFEFKARHAGREIYYENHAMRVREAGTGPGISVSMRDVTERRQLEREILDVSTRERQSIGRDLHDGLGQELTGVALMLRALATKIRSRCPEVVEHVDEVVGLVNQSIETARSLARGLLPVRTETGGLSSALRALVERSRDLYGVDVHFHEDTTPEFGLDETSASHLYRIAQEALTNASRHGQARRVVVELRARGEHFSLAITDDGRGFKPPTPSSSGMGLRIMRYRAGMIGARFAIEAAQPHGTVIRVSRERRGTVRKNRHVEPGERS